MSVTPDSSCSWRRNSRCRRISSSRSASNCRRLSNMRKRLNNSRSEFTGDLLSDRLDHAGYGSDYALELRCFDGDLLAAGRGQLVIARAAVSGGDAPLCGHPALDEHALQRRVQRTLFDLQNVVGDALNGVGDLIAVHLARACESSQNQKMESARRNFVRLQGSPWHS